MKNSVYLIDGYGLIYRSYFAHIKNPLKNSKGENTSAAFGFVNSLDKLISDERPAFLAVVMDSKLPTFRHEMFPSYKATRDAAPPDLHAQVPVIERILEARGIACMRVDGFEADDLIATIAERLTSEGTGVVIFSRDKDILQLVRENVKVLYPGQGAEYSEWGKDEVFANKGIYPEQVCDFLALCGDSSDNVPGVSGVGEKTAVKLLSSYASLDGVYENLPNIALSLKEKLAKGKENAYLSKKLVVLKKDVPLRFDLDSFRIKEQDYALLRSIYSACDFKSLLRKLEETAGTERIGEAQVIASSQGALSVTKPGTYVTVASLSELDLWIAASKKKGIVAFDTETDNIDAVRAKPIGFSLCYEEGAACYVPICAIGVECPDEEEVRKRLASLLCDPLQKIVGQNIKYDYIVMKRWGVTIANPWFDTMLAAWVLDSQAGAYNMDTLAERHLGHKTIRYKDLIPKNDGTILADLPIQAVTDYSGEDAEVTFRLFRAFEKKLGEPGNEGLNSVFRNVEMPLVSVLADMELAGISIDSGYLARYGRELDERIGALEKKIFAESGYTFNIRSTRELATFLFEKLGLPKIKKTKTGSSTDAEVLRELALISTVAGDVLCHRMLSKLKSTYADALPAQVNPATGRLHTQYLQAGTATGRLSSASPNLQNIPVRDEEGKKIRAAFRSDPGYIFISADYSQIELVVLAHLSGDKRLKEAFLKGKDIHSQTAALVFGKSEAEVTDRMRRVGKTINFGVIYGMSAFRLSKDLKIPRQDAESFIKAYFTEYSGVKILALKTIEKAASVGYVETISGRRRPIDRRIKSANKAERAQEERIAVNSEIQGSAADIVKLAMKEVVKNIASRGLKTRLLLQVHDELIFEAQEDEKDEAVRIIKETMENVVQLDVPLHVGISTGKSWGELH